MTIQFITSQKAKKQREQIVEEVRLRLKKLKQLPDKEHTKEMCRLRSHPSYGRYIRQLKDGSLKLNKMKIREDEKYDGKYLIKTSDDTLSVEDVALGYKQLLVIEESFRTLKQELEIRPVYHRLEERIRAHVLLSWLALLLVRIVENATNMTWRKIRHELEKIQVGKFIFNCGEVYQCTQLTKEQLKILREIGIDKPPRYLKIEAKS